MKRFLRSILIFLFFASLIACLLDIIISVGLRKSGLRKYTVWADIFNGGINADLLVLGSSRACCGFNTYILDSVLHCNSYNIGIDGHPIDMQLIRYQTYRRFNSPPHLILINTDFLSTLGNSADDRYEREQFFPFVWDCALVKQVAELKQITAFDRTIPLFRYFGYQEDLNYGLESFFGRREFIDGGLHKGYRVNTAGWNPGSTLYKDTLVSVSFETNDILSLDTFVEQSRKEGIGIVFVKSPVYYPLLDKFSNVAETDSIFSHIAAKYSIPIFDFYNAEYCHDSCYFSDPSHLNYLGSILFTKDLCKAIQSNDSLIESILTQ